MAAAHAQGIYIYTIYTARIFRASVGVQPTIFGRQSKLTQVIAK